MNDTYLIPANASRGKLIFGYFRPIDLVIFLIGITISFILLIMFQNEMDNTWIAVLVLVPAAICIFLVIPIPYQHNILTLLTAIYKFYFVNRQTYKWKGWCMQYDETADKRQN